MYTVRLGCYGAARPFFRLAAILKMNGSSPEAITKRSACWIIRVFWFLTMRSVCILIMRRGPLDIAAGNCRLKNTAPTFGVRGK